MGKILIIEDNPANMKLAVFLLDGAGYVVLQAQDAETGLALAHSEQPDLILMDMQLPGIDGLSATRQLKSNPVTQKIKIVALTGMAMKGDEDRIRKAGCDGYIPKPVLYESFLGTIKQILGNL